MTTPAPSGLRSSRKRKVIHIASLKPKDWLVQNHRNTFCRVMKVCLTAQVLRAQSPGSSPSTAQSRGRKSEHQCPPREDFTRLLTRTGDLCIPPLSMHPCFLPVPPGKSSKRTCNAGIGKPSHIPGESGLDHLQHRVICTLDLYCEFGI